MIVLLAILIVATATTLVLGAVVLKGATTSTHRRTLEDLDQLRALHGHRGGGSDNGGRRPVWATQDGT